MLPLLAPQPKLMFMLGVGKEIPSGVGIKLVPTHNKGSVHCLELTNGYMMCI